MQFDQLKRREFMTLLGGAAAAWPLAAGAQLAPRLVGMLLPGTEDEVLSRGFAAAFEQGLGARGWRIGANVRIEYHWAVDSADKTKAAIAELQARPPDVVLANTSHTVAELLKAMPATPIVFMMIYEPVTQGFVQSLAHPGGNATGFTAVVATIGSKWLELLVEMAPRVARVAYACNPNNPGPQQPYAAVEAAARGHGVAVTLAPIHSGADIETLMASLAEQPGGGLIAPPDGFLIQFKNLIVEHAARLKLPAIYGDSWFPRHGGLASYGVNMPEQFREAAAYVDRIFRGAKPADLPVQEPSRYALDINLKTAKALGLEIPPTLLAAADELIE